MDTEPSVRTIGKYEVVGVIGRGGMGVVYRAIDPAIGRTVAIKMLKGGYADDRDLLQRFYREARSTGNLQHRNIVTIFALGDMDGIPYLVMEYLEGQSVSEIITSRRAMSLVEKLDLIVQICDGLHYAHCRNLIHRDIKPANVIVLPDGTSKIVDFGIARLTASQGLTQTGQVLGSPFYMSPEQINSQPLDARTDVFSTGVVLYELLTYDLPFKGADAATIFMKILSGDPPPLSKYLQDYPRELDEIVSRALAKQLDDRYQSAEELGFDLLQVQRELREGMTKFYLQVAESCIRREDLERARLQLQEVLKLDRQNEGANRLLRQVRQAQQQQLRKSRVAQMRSQAQVALAGHQYEEALACAEQACQLDPTDIDSERLREEIRNTIDRLQLLRSLLSRAESAMYAGELEDAKRSADEAVRLVPDDSQAKALASAVEKELAARSRRAAIQNFVDNARQEISARNFVKAIDNLHQAEKLDPGDSNVAELLRWANRGQEQGERRHALQEMLTHIDEALRTGDFVSACTMCDMGLAQFPSEPSLLKLKTIAERQREVASRRQFVQEQSVAVRRLAEAGQHEAALQLLTGALRRYPEEPNLETLRALIGGELEMLTRERLERERQLAAEEAARQLAAETQQRVLNAAANLRRYLDEQQDFAAAANIASELQQFLSSEALDQKTRDVGTAILSEYQARASAREQARKELERLIEAADALNPVLRNQAGERALAIQAAYPNDQQIQAAYAAVTANLERWSQRRGMAIAQLANIARSLAQLPLAEAAQTKDRAEQIGAPFGSDPQIGSLLQQIGNECEKRARYRQRLLEGLGNFKVRVTQIPSLVELNEVLDQAHSLLFSQQSDAEISSMFSDFKTAVEDRRRDMEALVSRTQQIAKQIEQAATVDLAENLLEKVNQLAADNPENLDVQEMATRIAGQVRGRRAEHDLIVHELTSLHAIVSQTALAEDLALIRQRSAECRAKHQRDPEIAALCNQIESEAGFRQFVQEQSVAARGLAQTGQYQAALDLLADALRRYPNEPNLEKLQAVINSELEELTRERRERERQQAAQEAARRLAAEMQQRVLNAVADLRRCLDEQQDFAAAENIASELQQFLSSELLDEATRDTGMAIVSQYQSRAGAREQALKELHQLAKVSEDSCDSVRCRQAGERAQAIQAAYLKDQEIQAAYAAVTANLDRWSQRRGEAIVELAEIAKSLPEVPLVQAQRSKDRAEGLVVPFGADAELASLLQQIRHGYDHREREHQRLLESLEKLSVQISQTRSLAELNELLEARSLTSPYDSDPAVSSALSRVKTGGEERRRTLEALVRQAQEIAEQANHAATVDLAETLLEKGNRLAAEHPDNLDAQEVVTSLFTQVRSLRAAHDAVVQELASLRSDVSEAQSPKDLAPVLQRCREYRSKHPDPQITALCDNIESHAGRRKFVLEQCVAARGLAESGRHDDALELLAEALRGYPEDPTLESLRSAISQELEILKRERERQQAAQEAARRLAAEMQQRVLNAVADLRRCLDEQQDFAAAENIASELQQFLSSELLDEATRDTGMAILSQHQSRAAAREQALKELHQLAKVSEDSCDSVRCRQAGERAQAIQAAYLKDQEIQAAYADATANLDRWLQRRDKAIAELANVAKSLAQGPLSQVEQSRHQAEEIAIPFGSDPEIGSLTQQIRDKCKQRARHHQQLLKELENFSSQIPRTRSLAELNDLLDQAHSRVSSQESDPAILSAFSNLKTAGDDRRRSLEVLLQQAKQLAEQVDRAATVDLAETLLDKGNKLAAANLENLDAQEVVTRIFTQVRVRRAEHDLILRELASLQSTVPQVQSAEQLEIIRKRSADCRTKHQRDPKITALCDQIESAGKRRQFVLEQSVAARRLAESGQHEAALQLLAEALRRYPKEPDLETLRALISGELETLTRERLERERQQAAEEAARQLSAEMQQRVLSAAAQLRRCLDEQQDFAATSSVSSDLQQLLSSEVLDQATREIGVAAVREYQSRAAARDRARAELQQLVDAVASSYDPIVQQKSGERARALQDAYAKDPQIQALYAAITANLERLSECRDKVLDELSSVARSLAQVSLVQAERSRDRAQRVAAQFESDPQVGSLLQQIRNQCEKRAHDRQRLLEALGSLKTQLSQTRSLAELNGILGQAKSLLSSGESDSDISSTFSEFQTAVDDRRRSMEARLREAQQIADQFDHAATLDMAEGLAEKGKRFAAANPKNVDVQEVLTRAVIQVRERRAEHDLTLHELTSLQASLSHARSADELSIILQRSADCRAKHQPDREITAVCDRIEAEVRDRVDRLSKDVARDVGSQDSAQSLEPRVIEDQPAAQSPDRESKSPRGFETILSGNSLSRDAVILEETPKASFPEPQPAHTRTPLIVGVAAIALLAVAAAIWVHNRNKQEPFATVQITSLPEGASVHIRGTDKQCVTPRCTLELPAGNYEAEAKLQDYQDAVEPIHVDAGAKSAITIRMSHTLSPGADTTAKSEPNPPPTPSAATTPPAPVQSRLEIRHGTPNAEVIVDGKQQGRINRTGKLSIELPSGDHQLKIVAGEKESSIIPQHFGPGATVTLTGSDFRFPAPAQPAEQVAWQEIRNSQNPADFDLFLQRYPDSEYRSQAEGKLDELNWNRARSNETSASLRDYLNRFPNGRHSEDARGELQRLEWASIASSTDPGVLEDFAKRHPSGVYHDKAVGQLDDLAWAHTRNDDLKNLQAYLKRFPRGKHADSATAALESLAAVKLPPAPTSPTINDRPPVPSRPAVDDRASIVSTLEEYRRAYNSKNLALLQTIWPGMTPKETKTTETFFQAARSVDLTYHITGGPDIVEDRAIVHFLVQVTYVASGKSDTTKAPATMTLRKITTPGANTWQIESIK